MLKTNQYCDVCGSETEHASDLRITIPHKAKEIHIGCLCDACVEAIDNALNTRQHIMGITVTPYKSGVNYPYRIDEQGCKVKAPERRPDVTYV